MNRAEKIVFSREPFEAKWENTQVVSGDIVEQIQKLKRLPAKIWHPGQRDHINLLTDYGLIDEYQLCRPRGAS
jgi:dihydrofolate reductase